MVQHLLHIQNLVTPEIWYNIRRFRRLISPLGASGSGFGIFLPPPSKKSEREKFASLFYYFSGGFPEKPRFTWVFSLHGRNKNFSRVGRGRGCVMTRSP